MKYIALLRGINVGGNTIMKMSDLKKAAETCGFTSVRTHIQSGNIIFESDKTDTGKIAEQLEHELLNRFKYDSRVIVITYEQFKKILSEVPDEWKKRKDLRLYLAFVKGPVTAQDIIREAKPKEGADEVKAGEGVVYMSTVLSGLTKSGLTKLITKSVYKSITIRSYSTCQNILTRMES